MELKSLANSEKFPAGVGVAINREMYSWDRIRIDGGKSKNFITCWDGKRFQRRDGYSDQNAAEIPAPKTRPMTHAEVFKAVRDGAVIRGIGYNEVRNSWHSDFPIEDHEICYNYTGTDADVWQKMEVEE